MTLDLFTVRAVDLVGLALSVPARFRPSPTQGKTFEAISEEILVGEQGSCQSCWEPVECRAYVQEARRRIVRIPAGNFRNRLRSTEPMRIRGTHSIQDLIATRADERRPSEVAHLILI